MTHRLTTAYTDGSCLGNPGPGGWGAVIVAPSGTTEISGGNAKTTNNRMELMAAIQVLESIEPPAAVQIVTDSRYVMDGITSWLSGWKRRNWRTAAGTPVKNRDLWQRLERAVARHSVQWQWVRGHSNHPGNERADALARTEAGMRRPGL